MKLGFYYHIPVKASQSCVKMPAYLGVFLDALAAEVETMVLFMHEDNLTDSEYCDYNLKASNLIYHSLGPKTPAWHRFLLPWKALRKIKNSVNECDILLVRAPSPLAPAFHKYFFRETRIAYLIVGDYLEVSKNLDQPWWRKFPIKLLSFINNRKLKLAASKSTTLVNSQKLFNQYKSFVNDLHLVLTTTLSQNDFYHREDTCSGAEIKLLYTGNYSFAKGLRELVDAFAQLSRSRDNITLHFVGWDYDHKKSVESELKKRANILGVGEKVIFHGFKTIGHELNEMYRMADIYIIPSYHEGFPRTIWEAMANSLPVIATKVGSIPHFLLDEQDVLLIEPKASEELVMAIERIVDNGELRRKLIRNGFLLVRENTVEKHTRKLIQALS